MKLIFSLFFNLFSCLVFCQITSFTPGKVWKDTNGEHINAHGGGVLYRNGVYYWYGEHKSSGWQGNTALKGVSCYSSTDLLNWKNEGIVLQVDTRLNSEITKGCIIERPKVVYNKKTDSYVMWFHLELKGSGYDSARAAVAISNNPKGPFKFLMSFRPNKGVWPMNFEDKFKLATTNDSQLKSWTTKWIKEVKNGSMVRKDYHYGQMSRDMTVFVDDDEQAYLIYSSEDNLTLHIALLTDDYLGFTEKWVRMDPVGHNEAPVIFKKEGMYYMITSGCTGWDPNAARSFRSMSIWGPWEKMGNPCVGKDAILTFNSQSTFALKVEGEKEKYIFMADRWTPKNPIDGTYVWLPIRFEVGRPIINWLDEWNLNYFKINKL